MSAPQAGAPAQHLPSVGYYYDPDGYNFEHSAGQLVLRWIEEDGTQRQRIYDSSGMAWDGYSVDGQAAHTRTDGDEIQRPRPYRVCAGGHGAKHEACETARRSLSRLTACGRRVALTHGYFHAACWSPAAEPVRSRQVKRIRSKRPSYDRLSAKAKQEEFHEHFDKTALSNF